MKSTKKGSACPGSISEKNTYCAQKDRKADARETKGRNEGKSAEC